MAGTEQDGPSGGTSPGAVDSASRSAVVHEIRQRIAPALENVEVRARRRGYIPDPPPGEPRDGIKPGGWIADEKGLPPDCPVEPLGMDGDTLYLIDALGQLAAVAPSSMGQAFIQRLFGNRQNYLYWAWPQLSKSGEVNGWRAEKVREVLYTAAMNRGLWNAVEKVRGLGAWRGVHDELILHCGDHLFVNGEKRETGDVDGYFYPRRPKIAGPWSQPVDFTGNPARALFAALRTWNWKRPDVDPLLFLGSIGVGLLGGALTWRPSLFMIGDKAVGKSTLQGLAKLVYGGWLVSSTDTTAAGIYQRVGNGSLPVAIDELEAEADNRRVMAVVKLARLAASGGVMLRGGQDHQGVEFQARSHFLFSAINPPPMAPQDISRMALLSIDKLDLSQERSEPVFDADIGPKILRRLADQWSDFDAYWEGYRRALKAGGHSSRGQDTYGTFLTCAHLMLGDEGMEEAGYRVDDLDGWSETLAAAEVTDDEENWRNCLDHLLSSRVDVWRNGEQNTVGQLLDALKNAHDSFNDAREVRRKLAMVGLGLLDLGNKVAADSHVLAVPNKGPQLSTLFAGTSWGGEGGRGVWSSALRQGPAHVVVSDKTANKIKVGGVSYRCTLVILKRFEELTEGD